MSTPITAAAGQRAARPHRHADDEVQGRPRPRPAATWRRPIEILRKKQGTSGQGRPRDGRGPHRRLHRPGQEGRRHRRGALRERPGRQERAVRRAGQRPGQAGGRSQDPATPEQLLTQQFVDDPAKTVQRAHRRGRRPDPREHEAGPLRALTGQLGGYVHHDGTRRRAVQVEGAKADPQVLRDVCMHIAAPQARSPRRARTCPPTWSSKEKEIAKAQIADDPKNPASRPTSSRRSPRASSRRGFAENVLVDQPFVKDDTKTVGQLLAVGRAEGREVRPLQGRRGAVSRLRRSARGLRGEASPLSPFISCSEGPSQAHPAALMRRFAGRCTGPG